MAFSIARLTLYAIISSIEEDLRELILLYLQNTIPVEELFPIDDYNKCISRFEKDQEAILDTIDYNDLLYYADLSDLYQSLNRNKKYLPENMAAYLKNVSKDLDNLVPIRNRIAHSRPLNPTDFSTTLDLSKKFVKHNLTLWKNLNNTLKRLKDEPSFVIDLEIPNYYSVEFNKNHNLPIPDFDETGYIGRDKQIEKIINYCLGPYPVITVIGNGGLGKTATALRVAYDILDLPNCPFDSIVWTSSKTSQLTATEIIKIKDSIDTSLGIMKDLSLNLAGHEVADPVQEILEYMKEFKILLIIDNLETVLDERIKDFLSNLPLGSKVLITSRIGLGAYEVPEKLSPMEPGDSIQLLRTLANIKQVDSLVKTNNKKLEGFCLKLKNNPGYIKWFVSAVQIGKRPEEVLAKPDLFLEYCMSNVYKYLDINSKKVLNSMIAIPGKLSLSVLSFLNEMGDIIEIKSAINQLLTTNMVLMNSIPGETSYETFYTISDLAREYLVNKNVLPANEFNRYNKLNRQLIAASELIKSEVRENPFSFNSINVRSNSDYIVAKILLDSLTQGRAGKFDIANSLINKAKGLAPHFYEVLRVEAQIKFYEKNHLAAKNAYEAAIELEPRSAPLRFWYGGFLVRILNDLDEALKQFEEALKISPNTPQILLEIARIYLYHYRFPKSRAVIDDLLSKNNLPVWNLKKVHDLNLQYYKRFAEYSLKKHDNYLVVELIGKLKQAYLDCPQNLIDGKMLNTISEAHSIFHMCGKLFSKETTNSDTLSELKEIDDWFHSILGSSPYIENGNYTTRYLGNIVRIDETKFYGIIRIIGGKSILFIRSSLIHSEDWTKLKNNVQVSFLIKKQENKEFAYDVLIEKK